MTYLIDDNCLVSMKFYDKEDNVLLATSRADKLSDRVAGVHGETTVILAEDERLIGV